MTVTAASRFRTPSFARTAPYAASIVFLAYAASMPMLPAPLHIDPSWLYLVKTAVVGLLLLVLYPRFVELVPRAPLDKKTGLLTLAAGIFVFIAWVNLDAPSMQWGADRSGFDPRDAHTGAIAWHWVALRLFGAAVVVPMVEELFWRSFVLRWIDRPHFLTVRPAAVSWRAFVITALLFASSHHLWLAGIIAGVVYSILYMHTENLWSPIYAHATTNALLGCWIVYTGHWNLW